MFKHKADKCLSMVGYTDTKHVHFGKWKAFIVHFFLGKYV